MKFSTKSQYGLRAMAYLSTNQVTPLKVIARKENISPDYLEKIMAKLERAGYIRAKRGSQGGYFLAKRPEKIKISEIIKTLEGDVSLVRCLARTGYRCPRQRVCKTKKIWKKIKDVLNSTLGSITLADISKKI